MYKYPKWIVFQVTETCNLKCKMCYEWGENGFYHQKKNLNTLDIKIIQEVIKQSKEYQPYFELFGGEPLLYSHLEEVLKEIHMANCKVDIPTNGTLLEEKADLLVKYPPRRIWVSIDGPEKFNDSQRGKSVFQKASKGIEKLHAEKIKNGSHYPEIGVTMVVTPDNYTSIEELFIKELNAEFFDWFSIEFELYITQDVYDTYAKFMKDKFDVHKELSAKGLIRKCDIFKDIDLDILMRQIRNVKEYALKNDIKVIGYPKIIEKENLQHFYSAEWNLMKEKKNRCTLPWIYVEISANGDVTPCHTFYDYSIGNVYEKSLYDIWNGDRAAYFRKEIREGMLPICIACSRYYSDI